MKKPAISVAINRAKNSKSPKYQKSRESVAFTIHDSTPKEVESFITMTINSLGLPVIHHSRVPRTIIEIRVRVGRNCIGKGIYLAFHGLSPVQTRELLLKHLA